MKILGLLTAAILLGVGLGYAGTVMEFGVAPTPPSLSGAGAGLPLDSHGHDHDHHGHAHSHSDLPTAAPGDPQPKVVVEQGTFDFGVMGQEGSGEHEFVLRNAGEGPLRLKVGEAPCKCTVGQLSKSTVAPGDFATVTIEYTPGAMEGKFERSVPIHTSDPRQPIVQLTIVGKITPLFQAMPNQLLAYNIDGKRTERLPFKFLGYNNPNAKIVGHQFTDPETASFFQVNYEPAPSDDWGDPLAVMGYNAVVEIAPGLPMGKFSQKLLLELDDPEQPTATVDILGNVTAAVSVAGAGFNADTETLTIGALQPNETVTRKLTILARGEHALQTRISVKETVPTGLDVKVGPATPMSGGAVIRIPLEITVPKGLPPVSLFGMEKKDMGRIVLETTHPQQPELTIYVRLIVAGK